MSILRKLSKENYRLCCLACKRYPNNGIYQLSHKNLRPQQRSFSLQSTVDSFSQTQTGIFKFLSESTPVEYCQNFLINVHDVTGIPWWGSIICTTIMLRCCVTVPFAIYQNHILARLEFIKLEMDEIAKELKKETNIAVRMYKWDERTAKITFRRSIKKQWNGLIERDNCHPLKSAVLLIFQVPLWVSLSISLRNLVYMLPHRDIQAQLTFAQLSVGGFGWIPNLVEVDASLVLPICFGLLNLGIIEMQTLSKVTVPTKLQRYLTNFFRGVSIMMIPIASVVPSCVVLYWTTSSAFGFVQNLILISPKVRRLCHIPQTPSELEEPYQHIAAGFRHRINFIFEKFRIT